MTHETFKGKLGYFIIYYIILDNKYKYINLLIIFLLSISYCNTHLEWKRKKIITLPNKSIYKFLYIVQLLISILILNN